MSGHDQGRLIHLARTARAVAAAERPDEALPIVLRALRESLRVPGAALLQVAGNRLVPVLCDGMTAAEQALDETTVVPSGGNAYPLILGGRVEGVLVHTSTARAGKRLHPAVAALLDLAAVALRNTRLDRESRAATAETERARAEAEALAALAASLAASLAQTDGPTATVQVTLEALPRLLDIGACGVALPGPDGVLQYTAWTGIPDDVGRVYAFRPGEGYVGRAFAGRRLLRSDDLWGDPDAHGAELHARTGVRAFMAAPLLADGQVLGVLSVGSARVAGFSERDARTLAAVAQHVAVALARAQERSAARREAAEKTAILAQMAGGVLVVDQTGVVTLANPTAAELFGVPLEGLVGLSIEAVPWSTRSAGGTPVPIEDRPLVRALRGEHTNAEYWIATPDIGERLIWSTVRPMRDEAGAVCGGVEVVRDVTALRQAEAALRESEERYRRIVEIAQEGIWAIGPDHRTSYVNARMAEMLGYTPEEMIGSDPVDYLDDTSRAAALGLRPQHHAGSAERTEVTYLRRDGTPLHALISAIPTLDETGAFLGSLAMVTDITERRRAEQQRAVLARTEKLRALGQMASGIAHDLNQSLGIVSGYSELALQALGRSDPDVDTAAEMLNTVSQAALDGGQTLRRLLMFGRGGQEEAAERLDVRTLLDEVARLTAPRWRDSAQEEGRPIRLDVDCGADLVIDGDAAALRQALTNLVFNAVDAMPDGGVIGLTARSPGGDVLRISVSDTGVGMSPEVRARAFEPFFTTKAERGTGLGLAQVFGIVEAHRGYVDVTSEPGRGTTFDLAFPAALTDRRRIQEELPAVGPLRILAVDDEPRLVRMASRMLQEHGHRVELSTSGEEALERLEKEEFDVVLSDLGLGAGMNGWELAARVKARWPGLPLALATGWGAQIDPVAARAKGVDAVLAKPFRGEELIRVVAALGARAGWSPECAASLPRSASN